VLIEQCAEFIQSVGFPIFVSVYILVRIEPVLFKINKTISVLTVVLAKSTGVNYEEAKRMCDNGD
jgi:hypothetical protein